MSGCVRPAVAADGTTAGTDSPGRPVARSAVQGKCSARASAERVGPGGAGLVRADGGIQGRACGEPFPRCESRCCPARTRTAGSLDTKTVRKGVDHGRGHQTVKRDPLFVGGRASHERDDRRLRPRVGLRRHRTRGGGRGAERGLSGRAASGPDGHLFPLGRAAMWVRGLPERLKRRVPPRVPTRLSFDDLVTRGSGSSSGEHPGHEVVFGAVGRFWTPIVRWEEVSAEDFASYRTSGRGRIVTGLSVRPYGNGRSLLTYEVRTILHDELPEVVRLV